MPGISLSVFSSGVRIGARNQDEPSKLCAELRCQAAHAKRSVGQPSQIDALDTTPPQTTRARLRGEFIRRAQEKRRDFTVDWVHLKLNDQAQRTVLCKDPFKAFDDRVDRLIESM